MSIAEALVAIVIFSVAFVTAMMLYQTANRTYLRTDAAAVQQQNVRFALDRMSETLRDSGAGHNMLGSTTLADEQIEGAWESAIFVRGDFDGARELARESASFPIVTTGNDEIVGYVLRKPIPEGGPDPNTIDLSIIADLTPTVRDAVYTSQNAIAGEEARTVEVAASKLSEQTSPPYQLERVTFDDAGVPKYEVIAKNIFRLSFRFMEDNVTVQPVDFDTAFGGANTERDERARIRRIEVNLTGMTERPDLGYKDETVYDPPAPITTRGHRKFAVSQMIYAPNLGVVSSSHNTTLPVNLPTPTSITACGGHCRTYLISWPASTNEGVTTYRLEITAPAVGALPAYSTTIDKIGLFHEFTEPEEDLEGGDDPPKRTFSFRVAPLAGLIAGAYTPAVTKSSENPAPSTPMNVENVTAAQSAVGIYAMRVAWDPVTENIGPIVTSTCNSVGVSSPSVPPSPWNIKAVDLKAARVYRIRDDGTNDGDDVTDAAANDVTEDTLGDLLNDAGVGSFTDKTAAPCSSYFYRVKACDYCNVTSAALSAAMAQSATFDIEAGKVPKKPSTPKAVEGSLTYSNGTFHVQLEWAPVTSTATGDDAAVAHYTLERWRRLGESGDYESEMTWDFYDTLQSHADTAPSLVNGENAYYRYYLTAKYDCATPRVSVPSDPFQLACLAPATNTMTFATPTPPAGGTVIRPGQDSVDVAVTTTGSNWTSAKLQITSSSNEVVYEADGIAGTDSFTFPPWDVTDDQTFPDDSYILSVSGTVGECITAAPITRTITLDTVTCGQRLIPVTPSPWNAINGSSAYTGFSFRIENTCPFTVTFNSLTPAWQGVSAVTDLNLVRLGTTTLFTTPVKASGVLVPLSSPIVLAAAAADGTPSLSANVTFGFDDNFTNDNTQNGTPGKFNSVLIHVTSPQTSSEQLIDGPAVP